MSLFEDQDEATSKAFNKTLRFLSYRPRSEKEIQDYLVKKKIFLPATIQKTIQKLKDLNFVNDEEFTKWWIDQRQSHKAKSKFLIKRELQQKGVSDEIIEKFLEDSQDDFNIAFKYFEKKKNRFKNLSDKDTYQKAAQFLLRRGFSWEVVKKVLQNDKE